MNNAFNKDQRLLTKKDFEFLKVKSQRLHLNKIIIYYKSNYNKPNPNKNRIGLAISKKIGTSVVRNKVKRILRETYRTSNSTEGELDLLVTLNFRKLGNNPILDDKFFCLLKEDFKIALSNLNKATL